MSPKAEPSKTEALLAALRAPSAHNAQPWRLVQMKNDDAFALRYAFADKLDADPDDRDALLAMGAFYETLSLSAAANGMAVSFAPAVPVAVDDEGMTLGVVSFGPVAGGEAGVAGQALAASVGGRITNRTPYQRGPLPASLRDELVGLGCTLLEPARVAPLVSKASVMAWRDERFVADLRQWTRFDDSAPDGLTCACINLSRLDRAALRFALWRGRLPRWLAWVYAQRDVRLTKASSAVAVLSVADRDPMTLFDCGRRLLRSWVTIMASGHAYHPISIVIDQPTAADLTRLSGVGDAVAIFRVGVPTGPAVKSNRRPLSAVVTPR
ncbi:MAG: hypothetical protein QOI20_810 [Acidimicrobiaceae bacterium]|jgi:hypothetical protein|nr:hypothetical protein [Acidimicrobiaceae bacterium]